MGLQLSSAIGSGLSTPIGVTNGGTGTSTSFTQGSVVVVGASGVYTQDNTHLFYDATNHGLAIGAGALDASTSKLYVTGGNAIFTGRVEHKQGADVASATDLTLGSDGNVFKITGTTTINDVTTTTWQNGSTVTLLFTGALTFTHNGTPNANTAAVLLAGSANLTTAANTRLVICLIGGTWYELARTVA